MTASIFETREPAPLCRAATKVEALEKLEEPHLLILAHPQPPQALPNDRKKGPVFFFVNRWIDVIGVRQTFGDGNGLPPCE